MTITSRKSKSGCITYTAVDKVNSSLLQAWQVAKAFSQLDFQFWGILLILQHCDLVTFSAYRYHRRTLAWYIHKQGTSRQTAQQRMPLNRSSNFDSTGWSLLSNLHFFGSGSSTSIESPLFSELSACRLCSTELPALSAILVVYIRRTADWQIRHCQPITARVGLTFTEHSRVPWRSPPHSLPPSETDA